MGWASGGNLADSVWKIIEKHIPNSHRGLIADKLIALFESYDCDTMMETALWDEVYSRCPCWLVDGSMDDPDLNCKQCDGKGYVKL